MSRSRVLFFMSGSIAAFKACQVLSRLVHEGCEVQVVATPSTFNFIGAVTLEGLTGKKVLSDLWERGHAMDHIHLSRWADYGVLCPASANTIARIAQGRADDLVSAMILAWPKEKSLTLVPAMNHEMLNASITQENLAKLQTHGFMVAPTQNGSLACGDEGAGRMLEAEDILRLLQKPVLGRVLVTGGATREPIDGIRFLSNVSTGQTAATLCEQFEARGWQVTYLHGNSAVQPRNAHHRLSFESFTDLDHKLREQLSVKDFTAVVHCAAVSDYTVENPQTDRKLPTDETLNLKLKANFKILPRLREYSRNKGIHVVGFKLTLGANEEQTLQAARTVLDATVDAIVANDWSSVLVDRSRHPGILLDSLSTHSFSDLNSLSGLLHERFRERSTR